MRIVEAALRVLKKMKKKNVKILKEENLKRVIEYFLVNYDPADPNLPNGICGKCRKLLLEVNGLIIFHYENFNPHLFLR